MNIEYTIDPVTGLMRLSLKKGILEKLPLHQQHNFNNEVLGLLEFNDKLILTGGMVLKLFGFEEMSTVGDFDFLLDQPITEGEYQAILKVFKLLPVQVVDEKGTRNLEFSLSARKWSLSKIHDTTSGTVHRHQFRVDIFNRTPIEGIDIFRVHWGDREIRMTHPAQVWGTRVILGLNSHHWPKSKYKHWQKIVDLFRDERYLQTTLEKLQQIEDMNLKVISYNGRIGSNQNILPKALDYIQTHNITSPDFYDSLFDLTLGSTSSTTHLPVL